MPRGRFKSSGLLMVSHNHRLRLHLRVSGRDQPPNKSRKLAPILAIAEPQEVVEAQAMKRASRLQGMVTHLKVLMVARQAIRSPST